MDATPLIRIPSTLTPKSDTAPVKVYVKKPRGTLYWGGAGLDGAYVQPQLQAFRSAGIQHVWVGLTNSATRLLGTTPGTLVDAARAGTLVRYQDDGDWTINGGMTEPAPQFNLVGYSYGSLLAAQTANFYSKKGHIVDHLVLVGSPIDAGFLAALKANKNIKKVVVINLLQHGDPIYAGMTQVELLSGAPTLGLQMNANKGEGHFYYAHTVADSPRRWAELAQRLAAEGLR
ncbi:alpha/beta hydrolase [Chitinimonas sp. PSY-7]|uniref:alpha/beta hydrolase n=1 Tax=Chitinimonas sp. PSY-7 TaxID=3459088 RepID=UPI0040403CBB